MSPDLYDQEKKRGPNIRIPPAFFVAGFLVALLLHAVVTPLEFTRDSEDARLLGIVGWTIAILGLLVSFSGIAAFQRANTTMFPFMPASRLVASGPYRYTRNPMYLGNTVSYVGMALVVNSVWPVLVLPPVLFALYRFVIAIEEQYLEKAFGDDYVAYRRRVRRWI